MGEEYIVEIAATPSTKQLQIKRGELVYLSHDIETTSSLKSMLGLESDSSFNTEVFGEYIQHATESEKAKHRKSIAFIDGSMRFLESATIQENIKFYLDSIQIKSDKSVVENLLSANGMSYDQTTSELSDYQNFVLSIVVGLAKQPEIVVLINPLSQVSEESFAQMMDSFYKLILDQGMTCIITLSNLKLAELYPGRVVSHTAMA